GRAALALSDYCSKKFSHYTFENVPLTPRSAVEELEKLQSERKFDLIVVPNRRRNVLTRMFNPGIANRLLFHADIPMLVIPV
ncbi:MAG: universal stress protein, partial [Muribaculaceae bacterium]|nr:universal stress protein [Muribaculaceae bacterium]